jgi:tetratricopeptide (TPR) repeat protein
VGDATTQQSPPAPTRPPSAYEELQAFSSVLTHIRVNYVDSVTYRELVHAAIDGMLHALDPHSYLHRYDSAVAELTVARDSLRGPAEARLSPVLPSVEMFDYAIGIARVQQDDFPAARVAFQRALTENLGFYWAHVRLAGSALALADTATALAELALAVDLEAQDPVLRLYDGVLLYDAGRLTDAAAQLEKALELDPYYAAPHYQLGRVYQAAGKKVEAIEHYRLFLAHAAQGDADRHKVIEALTALGAAPANSR